MLPQQTPIVVQRQHSTRHQRQSSSSSSSSKPPAPRPPTTEPSPLARDAESVRLAPVVPVVPVVPAVPAVPSSRPGGHSRRASEMSEAASTATTSNGTPVHAPATVPEESNRPSAHHSQRPRKTSIHGSSGTWILGKTIGAGSMGKVKLARKSDGSEQVRSMSIP